MLNKKVKQLVFDSLQLYVRGGPGGQGLPSMGGHGGHGSNVIAVCREGASLGKVKHDVPSLRLIGKAGERSLKFALKGKDAPDLHVYLPPGVLVRNDEGELIGELNKPGDRLFVAKGGPGGCPSSGFAGKHGETRLITVDLRLLADVGLVGFPNAGKSSLLSCLSRARPRIASFPFTTVRPQLGNIYYEDSRQISVADLPGLIEGAHENKGLGHSFLKHIERTQLLLFVVGVNGFQLSPESAFRSAFETVLLLNHELERYNPELVGKTSLLAVNKMDLVPESESNFARLKDLLAALPSSLSELPEELRPRQLVEFAELVPISCKSGQGIDSLKEKIRNWLDVIDDRKRAAEKAAKSQLSEDQVDASLNVKGPSLI